MGVSRLQRGSDYGPDTFGIAKHIIIPEAYHPISFALDHSGSFRISLDAMLASINLNHEPRLMTREINNEVPDRNLPPKPRLGERDA